MIAVINEIKCIGCSKCIHACPVNAIIGAKRFIHTVMAYLCTGCGLCVASCPTKCISLHSIIAISKYKRYKTISYKEQEPGILTVTSVHQK